MKRETLTARRVRALGAAAAVSVCASFAATSHAGDKERCAAAYDQTQNEREKGRLIEARRQARTCSAAVCAPFIVKDCARWLAEIEASVPTVVIAAEDATGADTLRVRVSVDGRVIGEALDGKAIDLDPGPHRLRFELAGTPTIEQEVLIRQGEKDRRIAVSFLASGAAPPGAPAAPGSSRGVPAWAWISGGLGLAFAGAAVGFGVDGLRAVSSLQKGCNSQNPAVCAPVPPGSYSPDADNARKDRDLGLVLGFGAAAVTGIVLAATGIAKRDALEAGGLRLGPLVGSSLRGAVISGSW